MAKRRFVLRIFSRSLRVLKWCIQPSRPAQAALRPACKPHIFLVRQPILQLNDWEQLFAGDKAAPLALQLAEKGTPQAQHTWANMVLQGHGVNKNPLQAFLWFGRAAAQDFAPAMNMMGRCYENGWGVDVDLPRAFFWYQRAAERGEAWAQFNLADLYRQGRGTERDERKAFALYHHAAEAGHVKALNMLGLIYEEGRGAADDAAKAKRCFAAGAQSGDCWACFNYARLFAAEQDMESAVLWLDRSLAYAVGDYCRAVACLLRTHPDLRLRQFAQKAQLLFLGEAEP